MRHLPAGTIAALAAVCCAFAGSASANEFPVTGSVTINGGSSAPLPAGVTFGDSTYNASNGDLSAGKFTFPSSTITFDSGKGTATYQFSQTNTSMALVGDDGMAVLTPASMNLKVLSATYDPGTGSIPISLGSDCIFTPIHWNDLWGTRTPTGLDLMQATFTVPATQGNCGGLASQINDALRGNHNSIELLIGRSFALPATGASDLIFISGFGS